MSRAFSLREYLRSAATAPAGLFADSGANGADDQSPLRAELFSAEQMEQHGEALARAHVPSRSAPHNRLLQRLDENGQVLVRTCELLTTAVKAKRRIAPAGVWLLDNFYLIEEQIRTARRHLPKGYSRGLPRLALGPSRGLPRVYDIALEAISHGDGRIASDTLRRFVSAYQSFAPLTLGELWAIPIMLRLALIENLRRVGARLTASRIHVDEAQDWANKMMEVAESDPKSLILVIADMARSNPPMVSSFVAELARRLQGHGQSLALPLTWIEQRLAESSQTIDQMVRAETQQQAADQVSISNTIASLRYLGATDWREFVESMSIVERVLREDIDGSYGRMDFATRDRYRHAVASIAKRAVVPEADVAQAAIRLARERAASQGSPARESHVGFFLVDRGRPQLERAVGSRAEPTVRARRWVARRPLLAYLGSIAAMTALFAAWPLLIVRDIGIADWRLAAMALLTVLAASQLASALANWLASLMVTPQPLPKMDLSHGLPPELRALVVVPTLLTDAEKIQELVESLEVRFLGNRDDELFFGLLTDLGDAQQETLPEDKALVDAARAGIDGLNERYRSAGVDRFFLLHRPRRWNSAERVWMGYERKRGKLADLNALLRGSGRERFAVIAGNVSVLPGVKYVITLDTDTQLPLDAARQCVATMAHPLNRPEFDAGNQRVVRGYGILQPRMGASLAGTQRSLYARLFGSEPGIDPYTRTVSDVYQDLFREGSFIGKGIYDVDAFERALASRFPENRILSHDLLEGCYARSGLLSDVHLYEDYPSRYLSDSRRQERWIRGDWQVARWLLARVPGAAGARLANPISWLSQWKILDNLRRSLVPFALLVLLLFGWIAMPRAGWWTLAVVGVILIPPLLMGIVSVLRRHESAGIRQHFLGAARAAGQSFAQAGFRIACLPHEAVSSTAAVLRTTWRMLVSGRRLLEWSAYDEHQPAAGLGASFRSMASAPLLAGLAGAALAGLRPGSLASAAPVLALWLFAPAVAWWMSRPISRRPVSLSLEQRQFLRRMARMTWRYFEHFVTAADHWLAPDNFQEHPGPAIAHRTSPTNIGLTQLATLAAWDFGFIPAGTLLERTRCAFESLGSMERHEGHFFNWYDTQSLRPLPPRYVSSVDSGNLAAHLLTFKAGLEAMPDQEIAGPRMFEGLLDTLRLLAEHATQGGGEDVRHAIATLESAPGRSPATLAVMQQHLASTAAVAAALTAQQGRAVPTGTQDWAELLARQCRDWLDELLYLAPWLGLSARPPGLGPDAALDTVPTLLALAAGNRSWLGRVDAQLERPLPPDERQWLAALRDCIALGTQRAADRIATLDRLARQAAEFADADFRFLYDRTRHLLAIGFNVDELRRDSSFYDLLASEARLSTYVGIAQGQLPQESWFALGRLLTTAGGEPVLVSWSGSMFEYLMPLLVMPSYDGTLIDQTCRAAVARQIDYGNQRAVPWGVSESGYNTVDANLNYQYHAFGVPGLGLTRGLAEDMVVTPYAAALALLVEPEAACDNLRRLAANGLEGPFGFYEAMDFTPSRVERGQSSAVVRSFMAHHQGMNLLAFAHVLLDRPMQRRFESDPLFKATLLLLQERIPKTSALHKHVAEHSEGSAFVDPAERLPQTPIGADTPTPEAQLLSNGRYHVMLTNAGGGHSRWGEFAITRWREDSTCDNWGSFLYLRDAATGQYWSATHQPTLERADSYEVMFSEGRAEFRRRDHDYETYTEVVVSPEDDIELRRVRITNHARARRTIEVTSYAEVVLAPPAADAIQPSFGNLFVQTSIVAARRAILCTRRPRSIGERVPWSFHLLAPRGTELSEVSYETDRMKFVGRGRTVAAPRALSYAAPLSGTQGSVLDPIVAIRCQVTLEPGESTTLDFVSGAAGNRESCMAMLDKYQDRYLADRVFDLAWTHGSVMLAQINATPADAQLYRNLASSVIYGNAALRAEASVLLQNRRGQSGLWGYSISGDLPIVLVKIADASHIDLARQMIRCYTYWRQKGLVVDLVIWHEDHVSYRQRLQDQIMGLIATGIEASAIDRPGGIFVRSAEQISHEDRTLLQAVARVIISDARGTLMEQVNRRGLSDKSVSRLVATRAQRPEPAAPGEPVPPQLFLGNHLGGFTADGSEYVITTTPSQRTPTPWVNVLANPGFGTVVSESGIAYTWSENAHEFRLTPWSDDAVGAATGEAFYLRDEETGQYWSPMPLPSGDAMPYVSRHGFGYSVFEHSANGIRTEMWVYVDLEEAVKFSVLKVQNVSGRSRRLSATGYVEWVLGDLRSKCAMHVVTGIDPTSGALFARNAYHAEFGERVAFFDVDDLSRTLSGDRSEFIGRNGTLGEPEAMTRSRLSGRLGPALDPCGAIQVPFDLADGQEREIIFRLGAGRDLERTQALAQQLRKAGTARAALAKVRQHWQHALGAIQVATPDPALDVLANGWLLYQTLACRFWARSGYYQSGGAFGFRDQLQDAMALVHAKPQLVREHLLRCAEHQFPEGDVQHWWHPPAGRGVRTRCSDDYLWLPYAACRYVSVTGDTGVLDENVHFLAGRPLGADEESYYDLPWRSAEVATLYEHCARAIRHGLRFGAHGLPLIGSGDWNDGMNLVGIDGKGESVWLGFFLCDVLTAFSGVARRREDVAFAQLCLAEADKLRSNIAAHAWDGAWYLRGWFDDGSPLGSSANPECAIDSISQSWSVLSHAGEAERSRKAMEAVDRYLVRRGPGLVQLLDPPFDKSAMNPGYIKGYVPGVRENGGQYTHAAVWASMAFAEMGDSRRAWELLALINPLNHARSEAAVAVYKVEPYVVAADVYAVAPHTGRGGWTWYTGSAGWLYRLMVESLLGLKREGDRLNIAPCMPADWTHYSMTYRFAETLYRIAVERTSEPDALPLRATLDGTDLAQPSIPLADDRLEHRVVVRINSTT